MSRLPKLFFETSWESFILSGLPHSSPVSFSFPQLFYLSHHLRTYRWVFYLLSSTSLSLESLIHPQHFSTKPETTEVREKTEVAEAEARNLKEALEKAEIAKLKTKANLSLEKKKRKAAQAKVAEAKKKAEGFIMEAGHLTVEAFKASLEFIEIKVWIGRKAFESG
ncbi:hypothetical protein COCNU_04G010040 [Cocos nucifera]|uniref:Uncharacterized protein n=1 Tax=Cocos nucifera TaxID=13894 RepID=A0A8K0I7G0_COCNU|nr:hypothetical protein COCNU_04G010040 [Cocos nucifera]